jgi:hypothetical protein
MLQFSPCCGVAISPNSPRMACQSLQIAQPRPPPPLIPAVPGATLTRPPRMCPLLPMIFPGCTSSIVMSCALQDQGALQFCSEMLLLTSDWLRYHCHLGILFAGLNIRSSAPASSCTQSAPLCTDFLCLLAAPLWFEDPPPGFTVTKRRRGWLELLTATASFLRGMCFTAFTASCPCLFRPQHYRHRCYLIQSGWSPCL